MRLFCLEVVTTETSKKCAVLFSGGLDSSLAACYMIEKGYDLDLLHIDQGALLTNNLVEIRAREIETAYPATSVVLRKLNAAGFFRKLALTTIEEDILKYKMSLVCVGCKLAMHVCTISYCLNNKVSMVADGSNQRQERYGEQRQVALNFIRQMYNQYRIKYENPVYRVDKSDIKYGMFDRGLTIQPLEDTCLFSHTFSIAKDDAIEEYMRSKESICKELIERSISYEKNR